MDRLAAVRREILGARSELKAARKDGKTATFSIETTDGKRRTVDLNGESFADVIQAATTADDNDNDSEDLGVKENHHGAEGSPRTRNADEL